MKIGILQTGHAPDEVISELGDYSDMFQVLLSNQGFEFEIFNVVDMEFPETSETCDAWLITGSKHSTYDDHPWIAPLEDLIRDIVTVGQPMIGVCFGHQIIAQALGGTVEKFAAGWAIGRQEYEFGGQLMAFNAWHRDQVSHAPQGALVIARNDFCANAALLYGNRALTIQAHPEFGPDMIEALIEYRGKGKVPQDLIDAATEQLEQPTASAVFADQMADFFRLERPSE